MTSDEYITLLISHMKEAPCQRSLKTCTQMFIAYIATEKPDIEVLKSKKEFLSLLESLNKKPVFYKEILSIIIMTLQETYEMKEEEQKLCESLLTPDLANYLSNLPEGTLNRFSNAQSSMLKKAKMALYCIQEEHEEKDLNLCDEGYESLEQLSEETSSQ